MSLESPQMDGFEVVRSGGDHHHRNHEDESRVSSTVEDLGENSNTSSNEEGATSGKDENDTIMSVSSTADHDRSTDRLSCEVTRNLQRHNHNSGSRHHNPSRANYCQFETPADESRGTFPDDFDEELFINTGQLVEARNEPGQFDEEMDSNSNNPHLHNHGLNLDTADHSESSDIEELYAVASIKEHVRGQDATTPTSSRAGKVTVTRRISSSKISKTRGTVEIPTGTRHNATLMQDDSMQQDLNNCFDNVGEIGLPMKQKCLLVDESYNQDDTEDCINEVDDVEPHASFSSSYRKRKCFLEDPLPAKKAVTGNGTDNKYSILVQDSMDSDNELLEDDMSIAPTSPSNSSADTIPALAEWLSVFASWSPIERLTAINNLIGACEPSEVRHMMRVIEPQFQRDFISLLPKELALYVLSFLDPKDLLQAAQTCRYWRILCDDSLLWKEKCREAGIGPFSAMAQRVHNRRGRGNHNPNLKLGTLPGSRMCPGASDNNCISSCEPWKSAYLRQHNVEMNWRFQTIRPAKTLKGHDDHVITCLQFSANRIVSGSDDNTLKVWSASTGKCLRTLVGHTGGVWSSQMSGTVIVSGSTDRTLRVWNADTGACEHILYGHTSTVRCMHLFEKKVVSGSRDASLRVWDVESGECLHVLIGHLAAVRCVQYNGKIVVSGAYDFMVRVWDVEREECLHQLEAHTNRVYSLQFDGIHVVSGSLDTSIRVWDVKTGALKHTLMGHQSLTSGMELRENLLVSGNADSTVKIWDINTGRCLLTLSGPNKHLSAVTCLQLINKFVITSSDDGTVKLWDISTGDFVRNLVTLSSGGSGGVVWRIRASETKLVCAVGSRNGTEETKLLVLDFDTETGKSEEASTSCSPLKALQCVG